MTDRKTEPQTVIVAFSFITEHFVYCCRFQYTLMVSASVARLLSRLTIRLLLSCVRADISPTTYGLYGETPTYDKNRGAT